MEHPYRALYQMVVAAALVVILVVAAITFFNHPVADDFCYSVEALSQGFWQSQAFWYQTWTGRYIGTALISLSRLVPEWLGISYFDFYKFFSLLVLVVFLFSVHIWIRTLSFYLSIPMNSALISCLFASIYLISMPSVGEGIYWLSSSLHYGIGSVLILLLLSWLIHPSRQPGAGPRQKFFHVSVAVLLTATAAGTSEVAVFIVFALSVVGALMAFRLGSSNAMSWVAVLVTVIIAGGIVAVPGLVERYPYEVAQGRSSAGLTNITSGLVWSTYHFLHNITSWIINPLFLAANLSVLVFLPGSAQAGRLLLIPQHLKTRINLLILVLIWISLMYGCIFMNLFAGGYLAARVLNVCYLLFLIGYFFLFAFAWDVLTWRNQKVAQAPKYLLAVGQVILLVAMAHYVLEMAREIYFVAPRYVEELNTRYALIEQALAEGRRTVAVPPLEARPSSFFFSDIRRDGSHWVNECYAEFFGLEGIWTSETTGA